MFFDYPSYTERINTICTSIQDLQHDLDEAQDEVYGLQLEIDEARKLLKERVFRG